MRLPTLFPAAAALALAACASSTPWVHVDRPGEVVVGQTTAAEVDRLMGRANNVTLNRRSHERAYEYNYKDAFGHPARLTVVYNERGVVASKSIESIDRD